MSASKTSGSGKQNLIRGAADKIMECMAWIDTPQGFDYWQGVHRNLIDLANTLEEGRPVLCYTCGKEVIP
jgi:hypothetical protein